MILTIWALSTVQSRRVGTNDERRARTFAETRAVQPLPVVRHGTARRDGCESAGHERVRYNHAGCVSLTHTADAAGSSPSLKAALPGLASRAPRALHGLQLAAAGRELPVPAYPRR